MREEEEGRDGSKSAPVRRVTHNCKVVSLQMCPSLCIPDLGMSAFVLENTSLVERVS